MTIEQTVEIPADRRITFEFYVPKEIPVGLARIEMKVTPVSEKRETPVDNSIEEVRQLLQKEMNEKGTSAVMAAAGEGWEAYAMERYAEP
jgi:hypothetical protein